MLRRPGPGEGDTLVVSFSPGKGWELLMVRRSPLAMRGPDVQSVSSSPLSWA